MYPWWGLGLKPICRVPAPVIRISLVLFGFGWARLSLHSKTFIPYVAPMATHSHSVPHPCPSMAEMRAAPWVLGGESLMTMVSDSPGLYSYPTPMPTGFRHPVQLCTLEYTAGETASPA